MSIPARPPVVLYCIVLYFTARYCWKPTVDVVPCHLLLYCCGSALCCAINREACLAVFTDISKSMLQITTSLTKVKVSLTLTVNMATPPLPSCQWHASSTISPMQAPPQVSFGEQHVEPMTQPHSKYWVPIRRLISPNPKYIFRVHMEEC